jgi:hypothetical protein
MKPLFVGRGEGRVGAGGGRIMYLLPWEDEVPQEFCESLVGNCVNRVLHAIVGSIAWG